MLKNRLFLFLFILFCFNVYGQPPIRLVATTTIIEDLCRQLSTASFSVHGLLPVGADPHLYEPTIADIQVLSRADAIMQNGLSLEGWLGRAIKNTATHAQIFTLTEGIEARESEAYHGAPDPHAWMSVPNVLIYCENLHRALCRLAPQDSVALKQRYLAYCQQLNDLDKKARASFSTIPPDKRLLITSHDAFQYFGKEYGLRVESAMGTSTEADVSIEDFKKLSQLIDQTGVQAIFVESTINPQLMQNLAADKGIVIGGSLYADALGPRGSGAETYVGMFWHNCQQITTALTRHQSVKASENRTFLWGIGFLALGLGLIFFIGNRLIIK